jgi:N-acetyl-1-D-myo-inositol-2-amino-2-deoxy-alpha-D-glucopyranoside deacetylase
MGATVPGGGLLLVHAHPDDESIGTGATMARYAAEGVPVTLVTCTLGELGEVIPPGLAHLADGNGDRLGEYRIGELAAACAALGVTDHRFLGGEGRWRDSGMMGLPSNQDPRCFWQADVDEAAQELVKIIREVRPRVMISYDENGFYGHPDHIQAHRVAWRAFQLAGPVTGRGQPDCTPGTGRPDCTPGSRPVAKFYATALPCSVLAGAIKMTGPDAAAARQAGFLEVPAVSELTFGTPDEQVTTEIDGTAQLPAKVAAMRAHATQIAVAEPFFALSNRLGERILGTEYFTLLSGKTGPPAQDGREADLLAGLPDDCV